MDISLNHTIINFNIKWWTVSGNDKPLDCTVDATRPNTELLRLPKATRALRNSHKVTAVASTCIGAADS